MANLSMTIGLISLLKKKGLLEQAEIQEMMDRAQLGLEEMGISDQTARATHGVLGQIMAIVAASHPPKPSSENGPSNQDNS